MMRRGRSIAVLVSIALGVSGCDLGPDYKHPDTETPAAWRESDGSQAAQWPVADWWKGFGSPELNDFIAQAQQANLDLGAAVARVEEADAQVRIAGAPLLPSIGGTAAANTAQSVSQFSGNQIHFSNYTAEVNASYEIDFWGKNRAALSAAKFTALASRYDQEVVQLTVISGVATTYFLALGLQDRLQVARDNLANAENVLEIIRARQKVGTAMALDIAQQETVVAGLQAAIPPLQQQYSQALDALAILLGKPPEDVKISATSLHSLSPPTVAPGLPSELLTRRPDVREAEAQLIAANANIKVARAQFFPSISLTAGGGFESLALAAFGGPSSQVYNLGASLTQPIFEGGLLEGQLQFSKARYKELLQDYIKAIIAAFSNVEDSLVASRRTGEQQADEDIAVQKARLAYDISQAQFRIGTIDLLTVLTTENALFTADDLLVQDELAHAQALVGLFNALGGGWQDSDIKGPPGIMSVSDHPDPAAAPPATPVK
jgi:outer membrane protein, multidrug efflux system